MSKYFPHFFVHPAYIYIYLCKTKHETNRQFLLLVSITRQKYAENDNRTCTWFYESAV